MDQQSFYSLIQSKKIKANLTFPINGSIVDPFSNQGKKMVLSEVTNARLSDKQPSLIQDGFTLQSNHFTGEDALAAAQAGETLTPLLRLLKETFDAKAILNIGHIIRDESSQIQSLACSRPPAAAIHADWNADRIRRLGNDHDPFIITNPNLSTSEIKDFIDHANHWMIYNCWIPLNLVINCPLALCDVQSIKLENIISDLQYKNSNENQKKNNGHFLSLDLNSAYQWYYYPLMQTNEMLIFKQYDSKEGPDNFLPVFHTAFNVIPNNDLINIPRRSIEIRFLISIG